MYYPGSLLDRRGGDRNNLRRKLSGVLGSRLARTSRAFDVESCFVDRVLRSLRSGAAIARVCAARQVRRVVAQVERIAEADPSIEARDGDFVDRASNDGGSVMHHRDGIAERASWPGRTPCPSLWRSHLPRRTASTPRRLWHVLVRYAQGIPDLGPRNSCGSV
jgi:hypothetical protein